MPEKISKPLEKSEEEKAADRKLVEEIENDPKNPPDEFDPLEAQAEALPASIKGSDGDKQHVAPADGVEEESETVDEEDDEFGGIDDPSKLTAD